jgi:O-antigen/teichoic acid export membrane protein
MFAAATEALQRALSVIYLPISNLVLPIMNDSRGDRGRFIRQIERLGGVVMLVTTFAVAALAAAIPAGLPLLLGEAYAGAVPIALLWVAPLFIEAAARMVWGTALLTLDQYRWLTRFNLVSGLISGLLIFFIVHADLSTIVLIIGLLRLVMVGVLIVKAASLDLVPTTAFPLRIVAVAAAALALSWGVQMALSDLLPLWRLLLGLAAFAAVIGALLHTMPLIPERSYEVFLQLAGRHGPLLARLIPRPWAPR